MKPFRTLRTLTIFPSKPRNSNSHLLDRVLLSHFFSAQPEQNDSENDNNDAVFDSSHFAVPNIDTKTTPQDATWDEKYRKRADRLVFGHETQKSKFKILQEQEEEERRRVLAKALLRAALERPDDEDDEDVVKEEDQKSLSVGIVGAPNAGKSALTNYMVGTKVSAVSRKTNTTIHEVVGVMTRGDTQICFFDTPGIMLKKNGFPYKDMKARVENAWSTVDLYDMIMVVFDVHRHLTRPDSRVVRLIERVGAQTNPKQKQVLHDLRSEGCWSERSYTIFNGPVKRPWDEDPLNMSEEVMKTISLEVVRERLLDHVHQEIPYGIEHRLIDWKELKDGSLRIEQHFITHKLSQRKILVGKKGSKIGRIGMEANEELRSIYKREVHLILQVRLK
ncbi:GTP-binding protein ERG isoform X2 [Manihot esculenta]|uniref:GTP-binding protein ERG isoform X2 n=1 Tax=Manihot esculenta TaxID=3983 RepID=UPI001CC3F9D7|nr:GTP-binding protein ERG isoform X2 [Manihot esculenta]